MFHSQILKLEIRIIRIMKNRIDLIIIVGYVIIFTGFPSNQSII